MVDLMKVINIMNFVRQIDERFEDSLNLLYNTTKAELELVNEFGYDNTFLLQYDAVCDERYTKLFKENKTSKTELGLWYEIVEPLTSACGLEYRSENGWKWDWHVIPGFSMAYTKEEREMLIDEAMRKFKEVYGAYPKTIASWLIDTHTLNHLANNYDIDFIAICRDQTNTDAYTLVGGYFNQAYYPSINNIFTPAQTKEYQVDIPVFRLLGPCPCHNYDNYKYLSSDMIKKMDGCNCFTLETVWPMGSNKESIQWFFDAYYKNEDLGFSYAQIGQENSFGSRNFIPTLRLQLEMLKELKDVSILKMCDTGSWYKNNFNETKTTTVVAKNSFDNNIDIESIYYDSKNYVCNLFRYENLVFIRAFYLFDEKVKDLYLENKCESFDALYENLPLVDTILWKYEDKFKSGLHIGSTKNPFTTNRVDDKLEVIYDNGKLVFSQDEIVIYSSELYFYIQNTNCDIKIFENSIEYCYKGHIYYLDFIDTTISKHDDYIKITSNNGKCILKPRRN